MISVDKALLIHSTAISKSGGADGIRDKGLLEGALSRPFATFDAIDLYHDVAQKAAAIMESILINHPFVDGNKRKGYILMRSILMANNVDLMASEDEKYNFTIKVAEGKMDVEENTIWIENNIIPLKKN